MENIVLNDYDCGLAKSQRTFSILKNVCTEHIICTEHILQCKILVSQPKMTLFTARVLVTRKLSQTNKAKAHMTSQIQLLLSSCN